MGYTIGQLAKSGGVPTSTVRYYERIGLLNADGRTGGNYRIYSDDALERLRFIRAAHATGFTLNDISSLLNLRADTSQPCKDVQVLIEKRLSDVRQRLDDLQCVEQVLNQSLNKCRKSGGNDRCHVIDKLSVAAGDSPRDSQADS